MSNSQNTQINGKFSTRMVRGNGSDRTLYRDIEKTFFGRRLDTTSGHLDYDYANLDVKMSTACDTSDTDAVSVVYQINHFVDLTQNFSWHIHWIQEEDHLPNFLLKWLSYDNNGSVPSWTSVAITADDLVFDYDGSGEFPQICDFGTIVHGLTEMSGFVKVKLFRDTANASSLFAGADPYTKDVRVTSGDLHVKVGAAGSLYEWSDDAS